MADDKKQNNHDSEYIGNVLKPKQRKYRKREKIIAAVSVVAFVILVIISSLLMLQDAERAVDGNVELEYPIGDGENAEANAERFSMDGNENVFVFGNSVDANAGNVENVAENMSSGIDTQQILP